MLSTKLHADTHIHSRERKRAFQHLSELQFVVVKLEGFQHRIYDQASLEQGQGTAGFRPTDAALGLGQRRLISSLSPWSPRAGCLPHKPMPYRHEGHLKNGCKKCDGREVCMHVWGRWRRRGVAAQYCVHWLCCDFFLLLPSPKCCI